MINSHAFVKFNVPVPDEKAMLTFGGTLAQRCRGGDCILLRGDLGVGKTTFARGFIQQLRPQEKRVLSPTFTLVQTYVAAAMPTIWHFDLYRLHHEDEVAEIGLDEALRAGITLIEWPELVESGLPGTVLDVTIAAGSDARQRTLTFVGAPAWRERLEALKEQWT